MQVAQIQNCLPVSVKKQEEDKKESFWNGRVVAITPAKVAIGAIGAIALSAALLYLLKDPNGYKNDLNNHKVSIHKSDYSCPADAGELYRYGASTSEMTMNTFMGSNSPACITSVLAQFCKAAVEKVCRDKGDTCSQVKVSKIFNEHFSDLLCFVEAKSPNCEETFKPVGSTTWSWLPVSLKDLNGWESNPIVKWAIKFNAQPEDGSNTKLLFKTGVGCLGRITQTMLPRTISLNGSSIEDYKRALNY